tara:strand:- start:5 stop:133 length:129 start_codon:yes stop_codon:yes gene_type:complete
MFSSVTMGALGMAVDGVKSGVEIDILKVVLCQSLLVMMFDQV